MSARRRRVLLIGGTSEIGLAIVRQLAGKGTLEALLLGRDASAWATFDALRDPGTAGTKLRYSVRTGGVILKSGTALLVDVFAGAQALGL